MPPPDDIASLISALGLDADLHAALLARLGDLDQDGFTDAELLSPVAPGPVSLTERRAVAYHAAVLLGDRALTARYRALLVQSIGEGSAQWHEIDIETRRAAATFPEAAALGPASRAIIGDRLAGAFRYVQASLAGDPRGARIPRDWDAESADILSRLLTLVTFRARLLAGLEQFAATDRPLYAAE
ncbi:hypothetical protein [Paracoccus sp. S3-43]|uniref:hypothetical protein n=1 Tax=Paracoccus sp. S3-43 TaxID=3030011 RepID=UPI0023AF1BCD|nr:hypothetical protein [Paracoccus sp. S3-43]WEF25600.1 hypothetical protein PXD02_06700 [Paracoccus sp. S3-43]